MSIKSQRVRTRLAVEGLIIILIALSPLLFYSYKYTSNGTQTLDFVLFTVGANDFEDARTNFWYILTKLVPLMLLVIWFITTKQWWYHAILIPISMYGFQLFNAFYNDSGQVDENEIFYVVAVAMIISPLVYFIRLKLFDKYVHGIDLKAMDEELKLLKEKERLEEELEKLRRKKETLSKKM